jgi:hypothetical protein
VTAYGRTAAEVAAVRRLRRALGDYPSHPPSHGGTGSEGVPAVAAPSAPSPAAPDRRPPAPRTSVRNRGTGQGAVVAVAVAVSGAALVLTSRGTLDARALVVLLGDLALLAGAFALTRWRDVVCAARPVDDVASSPGVDPSHARSWSICTGPVADVGTARRGEPDRPQALRRVLGVGDQARRGARPSP